jgi:hypothetical protein
VTTTTLNLSVLKGCARAGCDRPHHARGLCRKHYLQSRRSEAPKARTPKSGGTPDRGWRERAGFTPSDQQVYKPISDLSQVLEVGSVVTLTYLRPDGAEPPTEIIRAKVIDLDYRGAVRVIELMRDGVVWVPGASRYLDPRRIIGKD